MQSFFWLNGYIFKGVFSLLTCLRIWLCFCFWSFAQTCLRALLYMLQPPNSYVPHTQTQTQTHTHKDTHTHRHTHTHTHTHTHIHTHTHTHTQTHKDTHTHTQRQTHTHTHKTKSHTKLKMLPKQLPLNKMSNILLV